MRTNTTLISWLALAGVAGLIALVVVAHRVWPLSWADVNADIDREFPEVANVTTAELAAEWSDPPRLFDVRTRAEFEVSHLPGAVHAPTAEDAIRLVTAEPPGRAIVVYCSVGWRSAAVADRLRTVRPGKVRNLRGSIFQWANEGRPLECADGSTQRVHSYNTRWGTLLHRAP